MQPYLIVGNGRLARHLCFYFDSLSLNYAHWYRGDDKDNNQSEFVRWATPASRILLAISDKNIESFILSYPDIPKHKWLHFSGALSIPGIYSAHPLGSFGEKLNPISWYRDLFFIIEQSFKNSEEVNSLSDLLPGLPNQSASISPKNKPYYHSLCVLSNNFSTILFQKLFSGLEQDLGIPKEAAYVYLQQTIFNLKHTNNPLTGPLARKDNVTIQKNIEALQNRQDKFADIYKAFVHLTQQHSNQK